MQFGKYITAKGILASVAHTQAEFEDIRTAYEAGYTHATHFYNAMPGFHKRREYKYEGTVESIYLLDDMTVEVVADGIHVPPTILRLVYKIKGVERTCLITDALACAASDSREAFDPRVIIEDGVCKLADHSALLKQRSHHGPTDTYHGTKAEIPLADAVRMASETPAKIMGVYDRKGSLKRQGCRHHRHGRRLERKSRMGHGQTCTGNQYNLLINLQQHANEHCFSYIC